MNETVQLIATLQRMWRAEGEGSELGLWWIAEDVRQAFPGIDDATVRSITTRALRPMLEHGELHAGALGADGSFVPWTGSAEEQLRRIDSAWKDLGRPPSVGDVCWFVARRGAIRESR